MCQCSLSVKHAVQSILCKWTGLHVSATSDVLYVLTRLPYARWLFKEGTKNKLVYFTRLFCVSRCCVATEPLTVPDHVQ
jgi:hypothetical protein